jgi:hypothetical protein
MVFFHSLQILLESCPAHLSLLSQFFIGILAFCSFVLNFTSAIFSIGGDRLICGFTNVVNGTFTCSTQILFLLLVVLAQAIEILFALFNCLISLASILILQRLKVLVVAGLRPVDFRTHMDPLPATDCTSFVQSRGGWRDGTGLWL